MTTKKTNTNPCRQCGLCCVCPVNTQIGWAPLNTVEIARLSKERWFKKYTVQDSQRIQLATKMVLIKAGPHKGKYANACVFLQGSPGHKTFCRIYPKRPYVCSSFEINGVGCTHVIERVPKCCLFDSPDIVD